MFSFYLELPGTHKQLISMSKQEENNVQEWKAIFRKDMRLHRK